MDYASPPPPPPPAPPRRRGNGCLIALLIVLAIALVLSFLVNIGLAAGGMAGLENETGFIRPKSKCSETMEVKGKSGVSDRIVRIDLEGIITSSPAGGLMSSGAGVDVDSTKAALEQAVKDDRVKAIVLYINSPGGEVTASDIIYAAVKEAAKKKPVVVYMASVAASGGYYISCGATQIVASETTLTASIGVIMESFNYAQLFDKVGLNMTAFTSGAFKDTLSGARPMREDEKKYIQGLVDSMYDRFLTVVSEARNVPKEVLKNGVADGRVVSGADALKAKLVDQIGYVEDAYALARKLGKANDANVVRYGHEFGLLDILSAAGAESRAKVEVQLPGAAAMPKLQPGRMYFLPAALMQ
jgi:protease IV